MTDAFSIPRKSSNYLFAESVFFEQFNKVEFFYEDNKREELYYVITKKLFPTVEFNKIFTLNGKDSIIEKAERSRARKNRVFIVDKDFDDILGVIRADLLNLFYLTRYSIENFYFEEDAVLEFIISQMPTVNRSQLRFKLSPLKKDIILKLRHLSCYFFIVQKNRIPNLKAASQPIEMFFCDLEPTKPDKQKISLYRKSIRDELKKISSLASYNQAINDAKKMMQFDTLNNIFNNIPGKHCISLLVKLLKEKYPNIGNLQFDRVCYGLAKGCSFNDLASLKNSINQYLKLPTE